jgi:hypothetical protein
MVIALSSTLHQRSAWRLAMILEAILFARGKNKWRLYQGKFS